MAPASRRGIDTPSIGRQSLSVNPAPAETARPSPSGVSVQL